MSFDFARAAGIRFKSKATAPVVQKYFAPGLTDRRPGGNTAKGKAMTNLPSTHSAAPSSLAALGLVSILLVVTSPSRGKFSMTRFVSAHADLTT